MTIPPLAGHLGEEVSMPAVTEEESSSQRPRGRTLEAQGGLLDDTGVAAFLAEPYANEATSLRRYDDRAKVPGGQKKDVISPGSLRPERSHTWMPPFFVVPRGPLGQLVDWPVPFRRRSAVLGGVGR